MQAEYDVSGSMPAATGVSIAIHVVFALLISSSIASSVTTYRSSAVTVVLTPSKQAPNELSLGEPTSNREYGGDADP